MLEQVAEMTEQLILNCICTKIGLQDFKTVEFEKIAHFAYCTQVSF